MKNTKSALIINDANLKKLKKKNYTAEYVALCRALAVYEKDPALKGGDYLACKFLKPLLRIKMALPFLRKALVNNVKARSLGFYYYFIARTKFFDEIMLNELKKGIKQIVILGAGLDSRAYRFNNYLNEGNVFEVDYPLNQVLKLDRLQRAFRQIPDKVKFVPLDFNTTNMAEILQADDFDASLPTLFLWEGVTMYLPKEKVEKVLSFISENFTEGTSIVFDYYFADSIINPELYPGAKIIFDIVAKKGEPYLSGFDQNNLAVELKEFKFKLEKNLLPIESAAHYLCSTSGHVYDGLPKYIGMAHARL